MIRIDSFHDYFLFKNITFRSGRLDLTTKPRVKINEFQTE